MIKGRPSGSGTIADGSITEAKLDANLSNKVNAVGSVAEGSITSFHIATGSILGTDICGNTITYANIANNAVTNTKIDNGAVTHAKLSSNCVQSHNIEDGTILGTDICGNTITGSNIAIGTITSSNIADGTILGTDISGATITGSNIALETITKFNIASGTLTSGQIGSSTIQGSNIAVGTITSSNILDGTILGTDISFGQISLAHLDASFNTTLTDFGVALEEDGDAIKELQKLQGVISVRNTNSYSQPFSYTLSYKHPSTGVLTQFASYTNLDKPITATHFFKLPSLTHKILIEVSNDGGVGVEGSSIIYGGTIDDSDGNNILLSIDDVNVMVEIEVAI
jgi:hypothetical protein